MNAGSFCEDGRSFRGAQLLKQINCQLIVDEVKIIKLTNLIADAPKIAIFELLLSLVTQFFDRIIARTAFLDYLLP